MEEEHLHHHGEHHQSHHHHHSHMDEATMFKNHMLSAHKRDRFLRKFLYVTMCVLAIAVTLAVIFVYSVDI